MNIILSAIGSVINKLVLSGIVMSIALLINFPSTGISQNTDEGVVIDQVIAIVGSNIVMQSDLETQYLQFQMQEGGGKGEPEEVRCNILESMVFQKLLLNQAELDSLVVSDAEVESELDRRLRYYISMMGSQEKFEEFYRMSVVDFKEEFREQIKENMLVERTQQALTTEIKITPSEVRSFYKTIPQDSLPLINSEVKMSQLVKLPPVNQEEIERVKNKLQEIRYRVINGENFATLAVLYSEDPGSAKQGGELGLFGRGEMYPEFEAAAFTLEKGEVSDVVKTEAGFHILQFIERRGEYVNVRHILLRPKVSPLDLAKAKVELDSIAILIENKEINFEDAVVKFSEDPSKNNGGLLINPMTGTTLFESDQLDPKVFFVVDKLEVDDISTPVQFQTDDGKDAYRILKLLSRTDPHKANLKQDYDRVQEWALADKKQSELNDWMTEKADNTYIKLNDEFDDCKFSTKWNLVPTE